MNPLFWFGGILGSASMAEFPVSLSNHVGFMPRLLYSSTHHSPESFAHPKTGWAQDAWLQWSYENWCFHLDIRRWLNEPLLGLNNCKDHFLPNWVTPNILFLSFSRFSRCGWRRWGWPHRDVRDRRPVGELDARVRQPLPDRDEAWDRCQRQKLRGFHVRQTERERNELTALLRR